MTAQMGDELTAKTMNAAPTRKNPRRVRTASGVITSRVVIGCEGCTLVMSVFTRSVSDFIALPRVDAYARS